MEQRKRLRNADSRRKRNRKGEDKDESRKRRAQENKTVIETREKMREKSWKIMF